MNLARLENSQRIMSLGDWELDLNTGRLVWSEEVFRILGISREEFPPSAATFDSMIHPGDRERVLREMKRTFLEPSRRAEIEHRIVRCTGAVRYLQ